MPHIAGDVSAFRLVSVDHDRPRGASDVPRGDSEAEQRGSTAQKLAAIGEMTRGIAHDFRNILAIIESSSLRLAEQSSEQPDKARVYIAGAREGVNRGLKLTSQLLNFAKQPELEAHPGNANEFLTSLERFLRYGAGPGLRIVLQLAPDIPMCLIDPSQFNAAILNLVLNARDAMSDSGDVQISTARCVVKSTSEGLPTPGLYVQVRVKDSGQGMSAETVRNIFDPFFTTKGENGTGLGLPQVCAFMRRIGGHIGVTSEPGVGTTFDLLFPAQQDDTAEAYPDPSEATRTNEQ